jgi:SAM-dependent methyltransferase
MSCGADRDRCADGVHDCATYGWEVVERLRAMVFGEDPEMYEEARPSYPATVIDLITSHKPMDAIDVGCGTGKAAQLVAARGIQVTGVEPDERMAAVSRRHGIPVVVTSLEAWTPISCDLMYAAQAWHWVDPTVGATVAGRAVRSGGRWAAFWNHEDDPVFQGRVDAVYSELTPHLLEDRATFGDRDQLEIVIAEAFQATGAFDPIDVHEFGWVDNLSVSTLVDRLATHSSHRLLRPDNAAAMHAALREELGHAGDLVQLAYTTQVLVAQRR